MSEVVRGRGVCYSLALLIRIELPGKFADEFPASKLMPYDLSSA